MRWVRVYGELIEFKSRLLALMGKALPDLLAESAAEIRRVDMGIATQQLERYLARQGFWQERRLALVAERPKRSL